MKAELIEGFIDGVEILHLVIIIDGNHTHDDIDIDYGSITLTCEDREFKMDVVQSYRHFEDGETTITCDLKTLDEDEIFTDCPFDLTREDLYSDKLKVEFFFEYEEQWENCTLYVRDNGCTKAIDVDLES